MIGRFSDQWVRDALGLPGTANIAFNSVVTDTRTLAPGALFVALKGPSFDAHDFLPAARDAGATGAVVRRDTPAVPGLIFYEVADTGRALGDLAAARRREIAGPVIGITGQNGKTSTKEMMAAALGTRWRTHRTRANLNNMVGVPLTILESPADTEALVVEAGANLPGEIARYREVITPDIAVVLNAGAGHLEGFGSVAGVVREKLSLTDKAPVAIVGVQPPELAAGARTRAHRVITAGLTGADVIPDAVHLTADGRPVIGKDGQLFTLASRGLHQAGNAMFVWAVAHELGLDLSRVARALEGFSIPGGRGELTQHGHLTILNDSYNANPQSFTTAIALAQQLRAGRRLVFVAGGMRELGEHAPALHAEVAGELAALEPELLALVGDFVPAFAPYRDRYAGRLLEAPDSDTMGPLLAERMRGDELVFLKGSRGVALERILPAILRLATPPA
ncbi:MAG TPA: UDP-N-acetylmuramoyl-tripeptide--D-alanyl-D-alanine ligase [Gemmatimonadales bacterium]|jgi:UDP-N-acetylmuramoyl-tripeptide--D-alanyl-D-alanine ligase|nr:UDP-N-acetylmuramoyl-tripeptide--D-alanyl-D-alanine ligase [Gemmatimonadales bacterium]